VPFFVAIKQSLIFNRPLSAIFAPTMRIPAIKGFDQQALEKYFKNTGMLFVGQSVGSLAIKMIVGIFLPATLAGRKWDI
jgi:hypothetical protein